MPFMHFPPAVAARARRLAGLPLAWLLALCALPPWAACAADTTEAGGVGVATIEVVDPVGGGKMPGFVFYPSPRATGPATPIGPYRVEAAFGAPQAPGAKPLVVISHGQGGSALGHHDLATYLAGHGFVVATLEHPLDNHHDQSGIGRATVFFGRPAQVSATIDALLADPRWRALVDPARIGVAGFSMGGYTSLLLVGAVPKMDRFVGYCARHPEDAGTCGLARRLAAETGARGQSERDYLDAVQKDFARWGDPADPRVKAAFAMAPESVIFDRAGLAKVERPVFLYYGERDRVLLPAENALRIRPLIASLVAIERVPKADHWVFLAPCSPELAQVAREICTDPAGVDRIAVHTRVDADALAFFRKTLGAGTR